MNRDEIIAYVQRISESAGSKLKNLLEKESEFVEKGNKYEEKFTKRQFDLAVDPIINAEYIRSQIIERTRKSPMSVKEIAKSLELSPKDILQHITVLQRRNLIAVDSIKNRVPMYRGLFEEPVKEKETQNETKK
ncbi:MAG: ArsR family transcriptional regulator [Candidatus Cloacimonadota bacterium]|nr:MAG: ArsR family transcriptional regulator [Candidatus Cloacimonadota bacterium]